MAIIIRNTQDEDIAAITTIYADHVLNGLASFEEEPPSTVEMTRRYNKIRAANGPHIVAVLDNKIVGYAYAGPFHTRPAYRGTVENSVYLAPEAQGQGTGYQLLTHLINQCVEKGFRQMIAVITRLDPPVSVRLHEKAGFETIGTLHKVGFKKDRWLDVNYMQKELGDGASTPL